MSKKIKVLVVEDSSLARKVITDILSSDPDIEVVGTANNGMTAIYKNDLLDPDVITMDIEMPVMDGLEALRQIIEKKPKPVLMLSVLTRHGTEETFKALEYGAVDFIPKPASNLPITLKEVAELLIEKVKLVSTIKVKAPEKKVEHEARKTEGKHVIDAEVINVSGKLSSKKIIGFGTSTGGPSALSTIFKCFPEKFPLPVLVVQHMPEGFTKSFSERLNGQSGLTVKEAEEGDVILPGYGYIAPGHSHIIVDEKNGEKIIRLHKGEKISGHMPSIDVLFESIADHYGKESVCIIMTGMGQDGARGILKVKEKGGYTLAQDEETSVVYGMNRVAVQMGAIDKIVPLNDIPKSIANIL
jgi:two-component system, chemotaxis family, protein-glutamate methylesterase/glutaminase